MICGRHWNISGSGCSATWWCSMEVKWPPRLCNITEKLPRLTFSQIKLNHMHVRALFVALKINRHNFKTTWQSMNTTESVGNTDNERSDDLSISPPVETGLPEDSPKTLRVASLDASHCFSVWCFFLRCATATTGPIPPLQLQLRGSMPQCSCQSWRGTTDNGSSQ